MGLPDSGYIDIIMIWEEVNGETFDPEQHTADLQQLLDQAQPGGNNDRITDFYGWSNIVVSVPDSLSFPDTELNSHSDESIWLGNSSDSAENATGTVSASGDFSVISGSPFDIPPGAAREVVIRFEPTATGNRTGTASVSLDQGTFADNDSTSLSGTGTWSPDPQSFIVTDAFAVVSLSWSHPDSGQPSQYQIEGRAVGAGSWNNVDTISGSNTSYSHNPCNEVWFGGGAVEYRLTSIYTDAPNGSSIDDTTFSC